MASPELIAQLKRHEGLRPWVYRCPTGHRTIGYGHNLDANPLSAEERKATGYRDGVISEAGADWLLQRDVQRTERALIERLPWVANLDQPRRDALVNMAFQLGVAGLLKFSTTLRLIRIGAYALAAQAMARSKWARQTPGRSRELAQQMRSGQWGMAAERMADTLWARQTTNRARESIEQMKTGQYQPTKEK